MGKKTDPNGRVSTNEYDGKNRLVKSTDVNGNVTEYIHGALGIMKITLIQADGTVLVLSQTEYDDKGRVWKTVDQAGRITEYKYAYNGQQSLVTQRVKDASGVEHVTKTSYSYDAKNRVQSMARTVDGVTVESTWYEYTANGQAASTVDQYGLRTEYVYDTRGQEIEVRRQAVGSDGVVKWLVSRTVYDKMGNVTWESSDQLETTPGTPQPGRATHYIYDVLGRVIRTEERTGVVFTIDGGAGSGINDSGHLVSYTAQAYDGAGRTWWTESATGVKTINGNYRDTIPISK